MKIASTLALLVSSFALITTTHAVSPYQADYTFKINKKYSGTAKRSLKKVAGNKWSYSLKARAAGGLARANQQSYFTEKKGLLFPSKNNQELKILFKSIKTNLRFNHAQKRITTIDDGKKRSFAMPKLAQDILTLETQIRDDMMKGKLRPYYYVADKKRIKKVTFTNMGKYTLKVPAGTFKVVKLKLNYRDKKRKSYFYLSPKHKYLPIKIYQNNKGKIFDFQLKKIR